MKSGNLVMMIQYGCS